MQKSLSEKDVTLSIFESFFKYLEECVESDCIVVGGGPAGLMCARELSLQGKKVVLIERNNYLGGGFWMGGYLMNKITVGKEAKDILEEMGVSLYSIKEDIYVADSILACSSLIKKTLEAGVKVLNMTYVEDVILKSKRVCGVVINWTPVQFLPSPVKCLDPVALESKVVVDATGHEAQVCNKLSSRGLLSVKGEGPMWVDVSEKAVVEYTGEVFKGLVVCGMAVCSVFGLPRMGPIFGGMLLSGKKASRIILQELNK